MAATITELDSFASSEFYDNRTWLNQEHWQNFFGGSLPSGVVVDGALTVDGQYYSNALANYDVNASYKEFRSGSIMANGIHGNYVMGTYIPALTSSQVDRLIVARVYQLAGEVKIVGKTKIANDQGYTPANFAKKLLQDEATGCTRDETYYEIPLMYEIYGSYSYDLRRLYYLPRNNPMIAIDYSYSGATNLSADAGVLYGKGWVQVYGGMSYDIEIDNADISTNLYIYPVPACSNEPTIVYIKNNSAVNKDIRLPLSWKSMTYKYEWIDNWDGDNNSTYKYKELVANDKICLILTPFSADTSFGYTVTSKGMVEGFDPSDYYTKQEETTLLAAKADITYVDTGLASKANTADLGTLAGKNSVDYTTEVYNKPTLGSLASKDSVTLTTDVTGILPIANGGTGANSLGGIVQQIIDGTTTIYVNYLSGDDSTGDGTSDHPYKTIQKGIDSALPTNHVTIMILPGEYSETLTVDGKNLTFQGISDTEIKITQTSTSDPAITVKNGGFLQLLGKFTVSTKHEGILITSGSKVYYDALNTGNLLSVAITGNWSNYNRYCIASKGGEFKSVSNISLTIETSNDAVRGVLAQNGGYISIPSATLNIGTVVVFDAQGSIILYGSISGTHGTAAVASNGGIVSTGSHILS